MADHSHIEWTDATWNPVTGCTVVSPGCTNCYAMRLAGGRLAHHPSRAGLTAPSRAGPVWTGEVRLNAAWLTQPLAWKTPRRIFVCAHGDLFHEAVPDAWIDQVFAVMALAPRHTFQVLTKRAARMRAWFERSMIADRLGDAVLKLGYDGPLECLPWPLPNVWLGVSAEDQVRADERIPDLLATPAAVRFLSAEPLLGPIDPTRIKTMVFRGCEMIDALGGAGFDFLGEPVASLRHRIIHWVIAGGESGTGARPMHPEWARDLRDQCAAAGVPFFFKQWGTWGRAEGRWDAAVTLAGERRPRGPGMVLASSEALMSRLGKRAAGRRLDGRTHDAMPAGAVG